MGQVNPQAVDVAVRRAPALAHAVDADRLPELAAARDVAKRLDPWVVAPLVHHEQALAGLASEALGRLGVGRHRLLDVHGHTELEHLVEDGRVGGYRSRDDDAVCFAERFHTVDDPVGAPCLSPRDALR